MDKEEEQEKSVEIHNKENEDAKIFVKECPKAENKIEEEIDT